MFEIYLKILNIMQANGKVIKHLASSKKFAILFTNMPWISRTKVDELYILEKQLLHEKKICNLDIFQNGDDNNLIIIIKLY